MVIKEELHALQQLHEFGFLYGGQDAIVCLSVHSTYDGCLFGFYYAMDTHFNMVRSDSFLLTDTRLIQLELVSQEYDDRPYADVLLTADGYYHVTYNLHDKGLIVDAGIYSPELKLVFDKAS
jgi:hypothetical protein